jgi:hypothetical protein
MYRFTFYSATSNNILYAGWEIVNLTNPAVVLDSYFGQDTTAQLLPAGNFGLSGVGSWNGIFRYATFKA